VLRFIRSVPIIQILNYPFFPDFIFLEQPAASPPRIPCHAKIQHQLTGLTAVWS